MTRVGTGLTHAALALAGLALVFSLIVYSSRPRGRPSASAVSWTPATVSLSMVVATFSGQGVFAHRWYPTMTVVREGDAVDLAVANPDQFSHQLEFPTLTQKTAILKPGESARLTFVADDVGVFEYRCALPHDPAKGHCTPDHEQMRGYLIVTAK